MKKESNVHLDLKWENRNRIFNKIFGGGKYFHPFLVL